jgi:hypothetical protein
MGRPSTRVLLLLAALGTSLGWTVQARANDGLCAESASVMPVAAEPTQPAPSSLELLAPLVPFDERELPWCTSADDPRCAPLPAHAPVSDGPSRGCAGVLAPLRAAQPHDHPHAVLHTACVGLSEAAGTRLRLERPPRA